MDLEIAVQDGAGAHAAMEGGATRVELCAALRLGGLTPSNGTVEAVLAQSQGMPHFLHALVRSRGGGDVYSRDEVAAMVLEIKHLKTAGVHGVVVGALTPEGGTSTCGRWSSGSTPPTDLPSRSTGRWTRALIRWRSSCA